MRYDYYENNHPAPEVNKPISHGIRSCSTVNGKSRDIHEAPGPLSASITQNIRKFII